MCQNCGLREGGREREVEGIHLDLDTTGKLPSTHCTHQAEKHIDGASPAFSLLNSSPPHRPGDRIRTRMELPAAGEHVFAVEGIEKKRIRKVTTRGSVLCKNAPQTLKMLALGTSLTIFPSTVTGQGRVPGQVARLVSQVSGNATFPGDFRMGGVGGKNESKCLKWDSSRTLVYVSVCARVCLKKKKEYVFQCIRGCLH